MFSQKRIVLGVSGGIAVYKAVELLRLLTKAGADVQVVMTRSAQEFVTPLTFQTLSGNPVHTELFNLYQEKEIGHISLADGADLFIVAPATANILGKVACGIADDLLSTTLMATKAPVLFAPAMNVNMYENPVVQHNLTQLRELGYHFVGPVTGELACGWQGTGKLSSPEEIFSMAQALFAPKDLAGERLLITAGPTREELDPVRYISNYSSGKMGYALARAAQQRGAEVYLISGPTALPVPPGVRRKSVVSALEMRDAVLAAMDYSSVVIKSAAVADYRPRQMATHKLKKTSDDMRVELEKNPDILAELGQVKQGRILVGFAAETRDLLAHAAEKLARKNLDLIVANDVTQQGAGFNVDTNIVKLLHADGTVETLPQLSKDEVAHQILDRVVRLLGQRPGQS
ncbi:MAG: bifunctional phosphopantothenoylcysteine decarboxylase/phosphopantothenate--cysteine ligase CoaBC [Desulfuromonadaceae bacterium]|nr:bifunctional phosphopantothenoylcysteine decarboxylase/phosphopantothenate--cysteine ligase CoaBC [Desulfuromonadaceae bacterium]